MKRLIAILAIVFVIAITASADFWDFFGDPSQPPMSGGGGVPPGGANHLLIDNAGNFLLIDNATNQLRIDGAT